MNKKSQAFLNARIGSVITALTVDENSLIRLETSGHLPLHITDNGQTCCEKHYITTDDTLRDVVGATILRWDHSPREVVDEPSEPECYHNVHGIQWLRLYTTNGVVAFCLHNDHSGSYGGFCLKAEEGC